MLSNLHRQIVATARMSIKFSQTFCFALLFVFSETLHIYRERSAQRIPVSTSFVHAISICLCKIDAFSEAILLSIKSCFSVLTFNRISSAICQQIVCVCTLFVCSRGLFVLSHIKHHSRYHKTRNAHNTQTSTYTHKIAGTYTLVYRQNCIVHYRL